jgi:hypothetical protein
MPQISEHLPLTDEENKSSSETVQAKQKKKRDDNTINRVVLTAFRDPILLEYDKILRNPMLSESHRRKVHRERQHVLNLPRTL